MTLLGDQTPSPHDQTPSPHKLPSSRSTLKSKHPNNILHQEANLRRQEKQTVLYDKNTGSDNRPLNNQESVFVCNALKKAWQPAVVLNKRQPTEHPETYTVES